MTTETARTRLRLSLTQATLDRDVAHEHDDVELVVEIADTRSNGLYLCAVPGPGGVGGLLRELPGGPAVTFSARERRAVRAIDEVVGADEQERAEESDRNEHDTDGGERVLVRGEDGRRGDRAEHAEQANGGSDLTHAVDAACLLRRTPTRECQEQGQRPHRSSMGTLRREEQAKNCPSVAAGL